MATNIRLRARTQTTNIKLSFTNDRCDLICALQQAELKQGTVFFLFSFFSFIWNPEERLSEADSPAWTGWPTGDRILIWDLVCAWWSSAAIVPPTPTHRCSIKSPDPCVCLCVSDRAAERKKMTAQIGCVPKFHVWGVDKKCARTCVHVLYSLSASLSVWTPVTTTGTGSLRAEVCDSAAVMDRAGLKAMPNGLHSIQKLVTTCLSLKTFTSLLLLGCKNE